MSLWALTPDRVLHCQSQLPNGQWGWSDRDYPNGWWHAPKLTRICVGMMGWNLRGRCFWGAGEDRKLWLTYEDLTNPPGGWVNWYNWYNWDAPPGRIIALTAAVAGSGAMSLWALTDDHVLHCKSQRTADDAWPDRAKPVGPVDDRPLDQSRDVVNRVRSEIVNRPQIMATHDGPHWEVGGLKKAAANHAKVYIIDDTHFYVGSDNMYLSASFAGLQEYGYLVEGQAETQAFITDYWEKLWKNSQWHVVAAGFPKFRKALPGVRSPSPAKRRRQGARLAAKPGKIARAKPRRAK